LVAITLQKAGDDQAIAGKYIKPFPVISAELLAELECPDFREKNIFEEFTYIFRSGRVAFDTLKQEPRRKKSFFRRIFGDRR
jgi:hypothetical protein